MKSNKLTKHKIECPYCNETYKLRLIRQQHEYRKTDRFSLKCYHCNTGIMVYTSVDGYYALHKTPPSKFNTNYKIKRSTKPFVRPKNKPVMTDLCYDLIQKRQSLNMTQYGAALHLGVSQPTYHNWEAGKCRPRAKQLQTILDFLDS